MHAGTNVGPQDPNTRKLPFVYVCIHKSSHKPCISLIHDKFKHQNSPKYERGTDLQ